MRRVMVLLCSVCGGLLCFVAGILFQREIGLGRFLRHIGIISPKLVVADLSPRFAILAARPIPRGAVVFLGDSLVDQQEWHELLPGEQVINRGVSGAKIDDLQGVFDLRPAKSVFCLIGANDIASGITVEAFSKRYASLLESVPPGTRFCAVAVPAIRNHGAGQVSQQVVNACNAEIKRLAAAKGFGFIEIYQATLASPRRYLSRDGLHLSPEGYELLLGKIRKLIDEPGDA